jgi:hypothetical protein
MHEAWKQAAHLSAPDPHAIRTPQPSTPNAEELNHGDRSSDGRRREPHSPACPRPRVRRLRLSDIVSVDRDGRDPLRRARVRERRRQGGPADGHGQRHRPAASASRSSTTTRPSGVGLRGRRRRARDAPRPRLGRSPRKQLAFGDTLFARFAAGTGTQKGAFRNDADTATCLHAHRTWPCCSRARRRQRRRRLASATSRKTCAGSGRRVARGH